MKFKSRWFEFELPDEWWAAAGMASFVTYRTAYRRSAVRRTKLLKIDEIAVPRAAPACLTSRGIAW